MLFSQRKIQLGYQSDAGILRNWAVAVGIHVVVAAHVETKNWISAGTLLPRWEHSRQDSYGSPEASWSKYQRDWYRQQSHFNVDLMGIDLAFNWSRENWWGGKLVTGSVSYHRWLDTVNGMVLFLPFPHGTWLQECHRHLNTLKISFLLIFFLSVTFFSLHHQAAFNFYVLNVERIIWFYTDLNMALRPHKSASYDSGLRGHKCCIVWIARSLASSWINADLGCTDVCLFAEYLCPLSSGSFQGKVVFVWQSCSQGRIKCLGRSNGP